MKRKEMLIAMQRFYAIRHVMLEGNYITLERFMEELLEYMEHKGILPPLSKFEYTATDGRKVLNYVHNWELEASKEQK